MRGRVVFMSSFMLYQDQYFTIDFANECQIAGHLIVRGRRSVTCLAELTVEEQASLSSILVLAHQVINQVIQPERVYTLSFCELNLQLHFHIFPRTKALLTHFLHEHPSEKNANGPLLFDWAR